MQDTLRNTRNILLLENNRIENRADIRTWKITINKNEKCHL